MRTIGVTETGNVNKLFGIEKRLGGIVSKITGYSILVTGNGQNITVSRPEIA